MPAALRELLAPSYLADLAGRSLEDLRAMRRQCQEVETGLSLLRRIVHGYLDILGAEAARRADGGEPGDPAALLAQLPAALADRVQAPGPGRLSSMLVPAGMDPELEAALEALVGERAALDPTGVEDDRLRELTTGLSAFEAEVSRQRQALFGALDAIEAEIARRYRSGDASVDALLT